MEYIQELMDKFNNGIHLDWDEKNELCSFLLALNPRIESLLKQYDSILKDYIFEMTYFNYHESASIDTITDPELKKKLIESGFDVKRAMKNVCDDLILADYLGKFNEWLNENHVNKYNREIYKQFKIEYDLLVKKEYENDIFNKKLKSLKLKFLYLYISTFDFYNHFKIRNKLGEILVDLNGISIEFDESAFAHIINGHVFNNHLVDTEYQPNKSLFEIQGDLFKIINGLIEILNKINKLDVFPDYSMDNKMLNIYLRIENNRIFAIHLNQAKRPIKGKGISETYQRFSSFYPVELESKLNDLKCNYEIIRLDDKIELFKKKNKNVA